MDMYLISKQQDILFQMTSPAGKHEIPRRQQEAVRQFFDMVIAMDTQGDWRGQTVIARRQELTFCAGKVSVYNQPCFLVFGPFLLKEEKNYVMGRGLNQYTLEELHAFLPLFLYPSDASGPLDMEMVQLKEEERLTQEENLCYNDDSVILNNSALEMELDMVIRQGDTERLKIMLNQSFFSEPGHYEVGNSLRKEKNLMLVRNTLSARAAERGGAPTIYIRSLCADYARKIEETTKIDRLYELRKEIPMEYCREVKESRQGMYSPLVRKCIAYIEAHLSEEVRLDQLSEHCHVSYEYLSRVLKKECGVSFRELLNQIRIARAQRYLLLGASAGEAAEKTGYKTTAHFCRVFRQQTNETPTQWQKREISTK